jgi:hypothetical protein
MHKTFFFFKISLQATASKAICKLKLYVPKVYVPNVYVPKVYVPRVYVPKCSKMLQIGPKCFKTVQNAPRCSEIVQNCPKLTKKDQMKSIFHDYRATVVNFNASL